MDPFPQYTCHGRKSPACEKAKKSICHWHPRKPFLPHAGLMLNIQAACHSWFNIVDTRRLVGSTWRCSSRFYSSPRVQFPSNIIIAGFKFTCCGLACVLYLLEGATSVLKGDKQLSHSVNNHVRSSLSDSYWFRTSFLASQPRNSNWRE